MGDMVVQRKLFIMRHAERVDFTFGSWIPSSFDKQGNYIRKNLNMPLSVPNRRNGPMDYLKDCPLTRIGLFQSSLTGEAMKACGVKFSHVFSSSSLRCVQTCTNVLKASDQENLPINIEPGLFEWLTWYMDGMPKWMSVEELRNHGYNVRMEYEPFIKATDLLERKESSEEYYDRNSYVTRNILENYPGNILLVAHAASLDTCSRQLTGKPVRMEKDFLMMVPKVTYASVAVVEQYSDSTWQLVEPPFPALTHLNALGFDWRTLLD